MDSVICFLYISVMAEADTKVSPHRLAHVAIYGLKGDLSGKLNGTTGIVRNLDSGSGRWEVDTETLGFKKLKPCNLLFLTSAKLQTTSPATSAEPPPPQPLGTIDHLRTAKLCRFGDRCWRPNCHFKHAHENKRSAKWMSFWKQSCTSLEPAL